jgi:sulfite exporter TauE/SafE
MAIEGAVRELEGIKSVKSDYTTESTIIEYEENKVNSSLIRKKIEAEGFSIGGGEISLSSRFGTFAIALGIFGIILGLYLLFRNNIDVDFNNISVETSYAALFILGLLTGFHCIGMCGGFVLTYAGKLKKEGELLPHVVYGSAKTLSYTVIGGIFGLLGSFISFTIEMRAGIAIFAGIFLIIYGLNMLNIFPVLRKLQLRLPSLTEASIGKKRGPFITGILNGFMIACGTLQAMYIFAAGTGSVLYGALALFFFGLGTLVPLLSFGIASNFLSKAFSHKIVRFSGALVILLGVAMAGNGLNLLGVGVLPLSQDSNDTISESSISIDQSGYQIIRMNVTRYGWEPNSFVLKKGVPVKWEINGQEINGCNNEIIVNSFGLRIPIEEGIQTVEFTPEEEGIVRWSCWMGMIPGQFIVTDDAEIDVTGKLEADVETVVPELPKGSTCDGSCGGSCSGGCGCGGGDDEK